MLTTEQVVAELGWTRKAIKTVLGVTPTLMRPPYGDIDDRVRAISLAMGMVPVIWTRTPSGATFDTNGKYLQNNFRLSLMHFSRLEGTRWGCDWSTIVCHLPDYPHQCHALGHWVSALLSHS